MTRDEHLAWAKARALEFLGANEEGAAAASMVSDLNKHPELRTEFVHRDMIRAGTFAALSGKAAVRDWIKGFH